MAKLLSTTIRGFLSSAETFVSGALGTGWRIVKKFGRWVFEIDDIVVRGRMTVFELLIQKIRAVKGALGITQASGKIKEIRENDTNYYIQIEEEMSFITNDIIRCMEFDNKQRSYWVIISGIENNEIVIPKTEFEGSSIPEMGDEIVQFGNTTDKRRQSAVYLHADEAGEPAIDVLFDINSKSFEGCTKIRIGGDIPGELGYKGFFCENGLIKSVNDNDEIMYMLRPDGSGFVAKEAIKWATDGSGSIGSGAISWKYDDITRRYVVELGSNVVLKWENLSDSAKENLKGEPGKSGEDGRNGIDGSNGIDANLLPWVEDWQDNTTQIGRDYFVSPKIFSGTRDGKDKPLTGVALGREVITVVENGVEKKRTGVFGIKNGKITFSIDADTGDAEFDGKIKARSGSIGVFDIGPDNWLHSGGMYLSPSQINFKDGDRLVFIGSHPSETLGSSPILSTFEIISGGVPLSPAYAIRAIAKGTDQVAIYAEGAVQIKHGGGKGFCVTDGLLYLSGDHTYYGDSYLDTFIFNKKVNLHLGWSKKLGEETQQGKVVYVSGNGCGGWIYFHDQDGKQRGSMELVGHEGAIFRATSGGWYMVAGKQ